MKQNDFLSAVGGIDKDLLEPVAESRANDKKNPIRFVILVGAVAAAIVAVAAFSLALGMKGPTGTPVAPAGGTESTEEQLPATEPIATVSDDTVTDTEHQTEPATAPIATAGDNTDPYTEDLTEPAPTRIPPEGGTDRAPSYEPVEDTRTNDDPTPLTPPRPNTEKQSEKSDPDPIESDTPRQTETERQSDHVSVEGSMPTPDLSFMIYASSEIVRGTVVGEGVTRETNPTGEAINGMGELIPRYGIISFFDLRVEEVFKGDVRPGDVIRLFSVEEIVVFGDPDYKVSPYRLNKGQTGIFCICKDDIWTEPSEGTFYDICEEGVFDRVDENGIYHSRVFDLDPDDLPALIAAADEKWVPIYDHYANNPI